MDIREQLRDFCKVDESKIKINGPVYEVVANRIALNDFPYSRYNEAQFPKDNIEFAKFVILSNIINFVSFTRNCNKLLYIVDGVSYIGSEALAMSLTNAIKNKVINLDFSFFASDSFTQDTLHEVFSVIKNDLWDAPGVLFAKKRFVMIKNFSKQFIGKYGTFENFFDSCKGFSMGEQGLVTKLAELYGYNQDGLLYHKRASLCAYMIHSRGLATGDSSLQFSDTDQLPPLADAHMFRYLAVQQIIDVWQDANFGASFYGCKVLNENKDVDLQVIVQLRACAAYGALLLLDAINVIRYKSGLEKISIIQLDNYIWRKSRSWKDFNAYYPYMLTTSC